MIWYETLVLLQGKDTDQFVSFVQFVCWCFLAWLCKHLILKITNRKIEQSEETEAKDNSLYLYCTGASWHVSMSPCHIMNIALGSTSLYPAQHLESFSRLQTWSAHYFLLYWCGDVGPRCWYYWGLWSDRITTAHIHPLAEPSSTSIEISKSLSPHLTPHQQILI